ncbi:MAG TPA: LacI family DNA-binding transcriptional regulator [Thermomicrobiales bacterium]|nr:LacI family DNA-binding transcriptional regulator [Thermomicrobiales bacterium]
MATVRTEKRITIDDVAREAEVSAASVSRVVSGKGYVSEETRKRVTAALVRTGYVVNRQARGLAGGRSQVIGLVVPDLDTSYIGAIVRGIDEELSLDSYDLMLYTTHHRKHRESAFASTLTSGLADGLLLVLPSDPAAYLDSFVRRGFPFVLIDQGGFYDRGPSVGATNFQGAYDGTSYLLDLGHTRIGFVTGTLNMGCAVERRRGYRKALEDHSVAIDDALIRIGDFHQPLGYERAAELLALDDPPTAIFASNDDSAFGVMDAVRDRGLRVGDDISVVGFDDVMTASMVHPRLTTVRQPLHEMGRRATRMLLNMIESPESPRERIDLATELVIRESCRRPTGP